MPLRNPKHEAVLTAFIADPERVGWRAYKAVYPESSQRAANVAWSRLLKNADFAARRDELLAAIAAKAAASAAMDLEEVLLELSKLGRANMQDFIVAGDTTADVIESLRGMRRDHAAAISELTIETYLEGGGEDAREVKRVKLKLHDKRGALAELRRHFEPNKHEHSGPNGAPIETHEVNELDAARRIAFLLSQAAQPQKQQTPAPPAKPKQPDRKRPGQRR